MKCECSDPGCPACHGKCKHRARIGLHRVDMEDTTGTPMCNECATDAFDSGLLREESVKERVARTRRR